MSLNDQKLSEIAENREQKYETIRATVPAMEEILYKPFKVLDHGFVRVVDYMGDDNAIVQSARVSYGAGTKKINLDRGLIQYLMRHKHTTPFEMCEIKFHIKLPMFVARQWIRHRTANVNEYSARYSILGNDFYLPNRENLAVQSASNRQGRAEVLSDAESKRILAMLEGDAKQCYAHYQDMLNEDELGNTIDDSKSKLARELARMNLPVNFYTEWYWKIDLHNLLHFLHLRADAHAQYEIRVYAEAMLDIVKKWVPLTHEAFEEYCVNGINISNKALDTIKKMLAGGDVSQEESGMSKREWAELMETLGK